MPFTSTASLHPSTRRLGLLGVAFALTALAALVRSSGPTTTNEPAAALRLARNPERLHLLLDARRVFGWIGGTRKHAGETVLVASGGRTQRIKIRQDNTFSWPYKVAETTRAEFAFGRLRQTIVLRPPSKTPPCVFFVVDRGVYRPNQTLHFAAFLRDLDEHGEFVPRPAAPVEVLLTSEQKKTTAARMKLTADEQGRLTGEYTFSDADPLDDYRLSIPDCKGAARIRLAEYRKTKVQLNIFSRREGSRLLVRFQARDYLDRPVTNGRVQFVAQIVHEPAHPPAAALDGKQFAYADDEQPPVLRLEDLTAEERLLAEADDGYLAVGGLNVGRERQVIHQMEGKLDLNGQGEGIYPIELHKDWLQAGRAVVVRGVMIDGNGREERRTKTIPLVENDPSLQLSLPHATFHVNEPIRVTARTTEADGLKGSLTLVAMRLSPSLPSMSPARGNGAREGQAVILMADWGAMRRNLATAANFKGDTATLRLMEAGAYMLTAIWHKPDGTSRRQEIGCTVLSPSDLPALNLYLDRDTYQAGDTVTASVRSQYADACVLVTLRDSVGLRLGETIRLRRGQADVKLPLPADVRYGCAVEVHYADSASNAEPTQVVSRIVHVVPAGRMLTIQSEVKPILEPGEKAILNIQINRREPVDLIVSVYDKALRNIAPDQSTDIRNFYLADERVYQDHAREVLRRRLGEMTLNDLLKQAAKWLQENPKRGPIAERTALQTLAASTNKEPLRTPQVAALLRLAGIKTRAVDALHEWPFPDGPRGRRVTVWEWLNTPTKDGWRLHYSLVGDTLFLSAYHPTEKPMPWKTKASIYYRSVSRNGGFQGMANLGAGGGVIGGFGGGMMGMAGLGGIGGIAGLGGGGFNQLGANGGFPGQGNPGTPRLIEVPQKEKPSFAALLDTEDAAFSLQVRRDFADSAYWNARLRTDADGKAHVEFKLPDSLTGWQVVVTAISKELHVGRHETSFRTARRIMVQPILPRFFTEGDKVRVSGNVHNHTEARQTVRVRLKAESGKVAEPPEHEIAIEAGKSATVSWDFQAGDAGDVSLLMSAEAKGGSDASLKKLPIVRPGVEHVLTASGFCKDLATINVPEGADPSQTVFEVRFVPTLTADLLDTLPYLVDYPYGCVEQTMSRFLPAIKVAQILKQMKVDNAELNRKLPGCVAAGIKRLLELQHADGGWGWWANDQTHEFMTPYALYGLMEAEKAGYVIGRANAIPRGLQCLQSLIDKMGAQESADRIVCMYVYGQRHPLPAKWWDFIEEQRAAGKLSDYALALSLELAVRQKQTSLQGRLAGGLRDRVQRDNGQVHWSGGGFSRWADDPFEITAAVLKALVAFDKDDKLIPEVLAYFAATKHDNRWNSTKATATIIYALCDYLSRQSIVPTDRPSASFRCNDGPKQAVPFARPTESRKMIVPAKQVRAGVNRLTFQECSPGMMYRVAVRYWISGRRVPAESNGIEVARRWWLLDDKGQRAREMKSGETVPRGAYLESTVEARPTGGNRTMRFVLVENPRPAGCEVLPLDDARFSQQGTPCLLREDREKWIAFHHDETTGQIVDRCVLHAELPGEYLVPPAHVEMMYQTEVRGHSGTFALRVAEK